MTVLITGHFSTVVRHIDPSQHQQISLFYRISDMHLRNTRTGNDPCDHAIFFCDQIRWFL